MLVGAEVTIIAYHEGAGYYIEGRATVISETESADVWLVKFAGRADCVRRFIDPRSQAHPDRWTEYLNRYRDRARESFERLYENDY